MEKKIKHFFESLKQIKLSARDGDQLRSRILEFIEKNPAVESPRPFWAKFRLAPVLMIVFLLAGSGVVWGAEQSLPGDLLFSVKVNLNEKVGTTLAFSQEAKVARQSELAQRRLEEAEKLAIAGKLSEKIKKDLQIRFEKHAQKTEQKIAALEAKGKIEIADEAGENFRTVIKAHQKVLETIVAGTSAEKDVETLVLKIKPITKVKISQKQGEINKSSSIAADIGRMESDLKEKALTGLKNASQGRQRATEQKIAEVTKYLEKNKERLSEKAYFEAETRLKLAESILAEGRTKFESKDYAAALTLFQRAFQIAQETKILAKIKRDLKIDFELKSDGGLEIKKEIEGGKIEIFASGSFSKSKIRQKINLRGSTQPR